MSASSTMKDADYLHDTTVIIDYLRNHPPAIEYLDSIPQLTISVITQAELIEGCRDKDELKQVMRIVSGLHVIPITPAISSLAVDLVEHHFLKDGVLFDDALIAATAMDQNLTLVTTEKKHFRVIRDLPVQKPY